MQDFSGAAFLLIQSSFMNLSNMLVKADFILPPDETELALLLLLFTVHQLHMPDTGADPLADLKLCELL